MKTKLTYIERKTMLYKTGVEYGDYTMNHVQGCAHGCKYPCYAFLNARRFGKAKSYEDWIQPILVRNTLELLDAEIPRLKSRISSVHLCFTTDPFMCGYMEIQQMSLAAIKKINDAGIRCTVLTKGLLPLELSVFSKKNEYGITLISLDESFRERIEPGAAPYAERIAALERLHDAGCKTWASIEPYPTPNLINQDLSNILEKIMFTNRIIFGRTNYNREVSSYSAHRAFYNEQAEKVINFCKKHKIAYHIKHGTITNQQ
jgi:DNA repair photolyase